VNTDLLLSWLGLPPGPWPPDDRVLLGVGSRTLSASEIEKLALERMDRLRTYQLIDPELVTEGMNRLAQAMIALTATTSSSAAGNGQTGGEVVSLEADALAGPQSPGSTLAGSRAIRPTARGSRHQGSPAPVIVDAELVAVETTLPTQLLPPGREVSGDVAAKPHPISPEPARLFSQAEVPPVAVADRRQAYRELALLRRLRKAWMGLRSSMADPGAVIDSAAEICQFWEMMQQIRDDYPKLADLAGQQPSQQEPRAGELVWAILQQAYPLVLLRSLVPSQRLRLAEDWARGYVALERRTVALRRSLTTRPLGWRIRRRFIRWTILVATAPEFWLLLATTAALMIAAARLETGS